MTPASITIVAGPMLRAALGADEIAELLTALGDVRAAIHDGPLETAPRSDVYLAPATAVDELVRVPSDRRGELASRLLLLGAPRASALSLLEQHALLGAVEATAASQWTTVEDAWIHGRRDVMVAMGGVGASIPAPSPRYALWRHPLLGSLATLVAAYARRANPYHSMIALPELSPTWKIVEWLRGEPRYGQARAVGPGGRRAIATFSRPPKTSIDELVRVLAPTTPGVAPLLGATGCQDPANVMAVLEAEPAGLPLATPLYPLAPDAALPLFGQLLAILEAAGDTASRLRTVRPELIYWTQTDAGPVISGLLPRCEDVVANSAVPPMAEAVVYPFDALFMSPELIRGRPTTAASPVFSACAVLLYLLHRRVPWYQDSADWAPQAAAILKGPPPAEPTLEPSLAAMVQAGLHPDATKRPTATALRAALRAAGVQVPPIAFLPAPTG
jgi:hypothetical protein